MRNVVLTLCLAVPPLAAQQPDSCTLAASALNAPDLAYDPASDVYLRVWNVSDFFGCAHFTYGTFHDGAGAQLGTTLIHSVGSGGGLTFIGTWTPRVANVRALGVFVVAWGWNDDWFNEYLGIAVVDAATRQVRSVLPNAAPNLYAGASNRIDYHDVGGDDSVTGNSALVVFGDQTVMRSMRVTIDAAGTAQLGTPQVLRNSAGRIGRRTIASRTGESGRHLIVFEEKQASGDWDVRGMIVDGNDEIIDDGPIADSAASETRPHCDGDGDDWMVAYRNVENDRLECVRVTWNSAFATSWATTPHGLDDTAAADWPVVAALGDSYRVAFNRPGAQGAIASVDATSCTPCESTVDLPTVNGNLPLALAAVPGSPGESVAVCGDITPFGIVSVFDGFTTDQGGGCGAGGRARAHCAVTGNQAFQLGLSDAAAFTPAFLVLAAGRRDIPCAGGCTLIPDLTAGLVFAAGSTDIVGTVSITAPIPADPTLVGGVLYEQWLLLTGSGCFGALALSNGLRVELQ